MYTNHQRADLLHESQKKLLVNKSNMANELVSIERKKQLDDAMVDWIIEDACCFTDFRKKGMIKFVFNIFLTKNSNSN